jgi:hypothetical protein
MKEKSFLSPLWGKESNCCLYSGLPCYWAGYDHYIHKF